MKDVLIVTSRNVATPGGEFSLIKNRARALERTWGIGSDVVSLVNTNLGVREGDEAFGEGVYVRRNFFNPAALLGGYEALARAAEQALRAGGYRAVILSGVGMPRYVHRMKQAAGAGVLVCADVHGYYGDGRLLARDEPFALGAFHTLAAMVEEREQKRFLRRFDRVFVVSAAYRDFLCEHAGCRRGQFYVVPCALGEAPSLSAAERAACRSRYRKKYGVADGELLLVYSGGASAWQCLPETVELYRALAERRPVRLLILSGDKEGVRAKIGAAEGVIVDGYPPSALPGVFCAADFFVMLRQDVPTNHFAYPNKFLEYAAARKPIITTPYIYDIAQQVEGEGVGIVYDGDVDALARRMDGFSCPDEAFDAVVSGSSFEETLVPFAADLGAGGR